MGLHHVGIVSPLEVAHPEGAHCIVHVCRDRLVLVGGGGQRSMPSMRFRQ